MPTLTRWFIKAALVHFVAALCIGVALAGFRVDLLPAWAGGLGPVYLHLFMVGWVTQLIVGVSLWMFPRHSREHPHGHDGLGWATFGLLNLGLTLRASAEPVQAVAPGPGSGWMLVVSAMLQCFGGLAYAASIWPRVQAR